MGDFVERNELKQEITDYYFTGPFETFNWALEKMESDFAVVILDFLSRYNA